VTSTINQILELLSNGEWHSLTEKSLKISREDLDRIIHFLTEYDVVQVSGNLVKLTEEFKELPTSLSR
jgi:hypothetical protein